jgi:hypothetical protein
VLNTLTATCTTGAHSVGKVDVVVQNPTGELGFLAKGYEYKLPPPVIASITPNLGPTSGGQSVTITGTGFVNGATVLIGGAACLGPTVGAGGTSLTCTTGAHAASTVDVEVKNPDNQMSTLPSGYTYQEGGCGEFGC